MKILNICMILALSSGMTTVSNAWAQDPNIEVDSYPPDIAAEEMEEGIPAELQDPAFDQYVNVKLLRDSWVSLDPAALADSGLQLAEGERILFRPHKAVSADEVLQVAVRVAGQKRDNDTLERLHKAATRLGRDELAAMITAAQKLAAQSRAAVASVSVPLDKLSADILQDYRAVEAMIEDLRIRGDREAMDRLATTIREDEQWPAEVLDNLLRRLKDAGTNLGGGVASDALAKLSGSSRSTPWMTFKIRNRVSTSSAPGGVWIKGRRFVGSVPNNDPNYWKNFGPHKIGYNQSKTIYGTMKLLIYVQQANGEWGAGGYQGLYEGSYDVVTNFFGVRTCVPR